MMIYLYYLGIVALVDGLLVLGAVLITVYGRK